MSADPPQREVRWLELGRDLVSLWAGLFRAIRLYERDNAALRSLTERIRKTVGEILDGPGELELAARHDSIFISGERIRGSSASYHRLIDTLRAARVGSFAVEDEVTGAELEGFARLLVETAEARRAPESLVRELQVHGATHIHVTLAKAEEALPQEVDAEQVARRLYLRSIGILKGVFLELRSEDRVNSRRVKRVVQQMIESLEADPNALLHLTSLKNYDEYTFNHSVNVAVLAIALGRHIGLARRQLYVVGQVGMFHDIGKLCVPKAVLNKPGRLTPDERLLIQSHPTHGFLTNASKLGVSSETIEVALGAYEHHVNLDGTGYPLPATTRSPGLLSRILAVVDRYDAMTSERVYRGAISPPKALAILYSVQRSYTDAVLLRYFMNLMGYFPLGTAVRLSDGSVAVVVGTKPEPELRQFPVVRMVLHPDGSASAGQLVDLSDGAWERDPLRVEEVLKARDYGIEPMDYLIEG